MHKRSLARRNPRFPRKSRALAVLCGLFMSLPGYAEVIPCPECVAHDGASKVTMSLPWWRLGANEVQLECTGTYSWSATVYRVGNADVSTEYIPKTLPDNVTKCTATAGSDELDFKILD